MWITEISCTEILWCAITTFEDVAISVMPCFYGTQCIPTQQKPGRYACTWTYPRRGTDLKQLAIFIYNVSVVRGISWLIAEPIDVVLSNAVHDGKLYTNSWRRQSSTSAVRQSAEDDRSAVSTGQLWSSVFCCCGPVDVEFAARQSSWLSSES